MFPSPPYTLQTINFLLPVCYSLMISEAWHGKGPGKSFNTVAQVCDVSHSFWVLKKEVLEVLELSWRRQWKRQRELAHFITTGLFLPLCFCMQQHLVYTILFKFVLWKAKNVFYQGYNLISLPSHIRLTCLVLDIQGNLEALIHELDNLHKVSLFELSGGQGWSTWNRQEHRWLEALFLEK